MIVITVQEQENGTELDHVPTHHHLAMERKGIMSKLFFKLNGPEINQEYLTVNSLKIAKLVSLT